MRRLFIVIMAAFATACASTSTTTIAPASLGPYNCVPTEAKATPPPRDPATLTAFRGDNKQYTARRIKPVLTLKLCSAGQVPLGMMAQPTVAKVNPLIRSIGKSPEEFFRSREIAQNLFPFQKVYYIPPGPDEKEHRKPPDPPGCNGTAYYGSCYYYGPAAFSRVSDGGGMNMTIERPSFSGGGHSLDEIAVQGGSGDGNIIELGWNLSQSQYGDSNPHLFIFHWINWGPTCYDACGWVQYSATYFPGMNLTPIAGRTVYIGYVFYEGNWWAWFDNQWLGYFPGSIWSGAYTQNDMIQWFGEVATDNGVPPNVDMGNGRRPTDTAAAKNSTLCDVDAAAWVCWYRDMQSLGPNYPPYFDIRRTGFGETRFGGPGH